MKYVVIIGLLLALAAQADASHRSRRAARRANGVSACANGSCNARIFGRR